MTIQTTLRRFFVVSTILAALIASAPVLASTKPHTGDGRSLDPNTRFYVPKPNQGALDQIADLTASGNKADANLIKKMIATPQAVWFTSGTPKSVKQDVRNTVQRAADKGTVPILVAYNIPFRDCAQFSAGGATSVQQYKNWIDGFAAGIGNGKAVAILEPDETKRQRLPRRHAQRLAWFGRCGTPSEPGRCRAGGWLLPERVELSTHPAPAEVRHLDLQVSCLCDEPSVLGRRPLRLVRKPVLPCESKRFLNVDLV